LSHNVVDHYATFKKTADIKEDEEEKNVTKGKSGIDLGIGDVPHFA